MVMMPTGIPDLSSSHTLLRSVPGHFRRYIELYVTVVIVFLHLHLLAIYISSGIMDSKAECGKESLLDRSGTRSTLFSWE